MSLRSVCLRRVDAHWMPTRVAAWTTRGCPPARMLTCVSDASTINSTCCFASRFAQTSTISTIFIGDVDYTGGYLQAAFVALACQDDVLTAAGRTAHGTCRPCACRARIVPCEPGPRSGDCVHGPTSDHTERNVVNAHFERHHAAASAWNSRACLFAAYDTIRHHRVIGADPLLQSRQWPRQRLCVRRVWLCIRFRQFRTRPMLVWHRGLPRR